MNIDILMKELETDEGFSDIPYIDPVVRKEIPGDVLETLDEWLPKLNLTIGFGTLLKIDKGLGRVMKRYRLNKILYELCDKKTLMPKLPEEAQLVIGNLAYNLGVPKLLKFRNFWRHLEAWEFDQAADEIIYKDGSNKSKGYSGYYEDVGDRAMRLAERLRCIDA